MLWFRKDKAGLKNQEKRSIPDNLWVKCDGCNEIIYRKKLQQNNMVCTECNYHFYISSLDRLDITVDADSFEECSPSLAPANPLQFPEYEEKVAKGQNATQLKDSFICGTATINAKSIAIGISEFKFMGGTMSSVVGEKINRLTDIAIEKHIPFILISAGGGGVRMQEGMVGLMQMAKTSGAVYRLKKEGLMFISVLTHPTMGGVLASYASLGDIIIAEPGALIGFAGPRVIKQTIGEELPDGFQTAEFQLAHGIIDLICNRHQLKTTLHKLVTFYYA